MKVGTTLIVDLPFETRLFKARYEKDRPDILSSTIQVHCLTGNMKGRTVNVDRSSCIKEPQS